MSEKVRNCIVCGAEYEPGEGFPLSCPTCLSDKRSLELPDDRYVAALEQLRRLVSGGLELRYYDCDAIGQKETWCTWGLCNNTKEMWPCKEDHLWPYSFETEGRVAPLYRKQGQLCPLEVPPDSPRIVEDWQRTSGCFYRCRVFQKIDWPVNASDVIASIDKILEKDK